MHVYDLTIHIKRILVSDVYLVERRVRSDNACTLSGVGEGPESNKPVRASSKHHGTGSHNASVHGSDTMML